MYVSPKNVSLVFLSLKIPKSHTNKYKSTNMKFIGITNRAIGITNRASTSKIWVQKTFAEKISTGTICP